MQPNYSPWGHKEPDSPEHTCTRFGASLRAQQVKNLPAMQEMREIWVQLGRLGRSSGGGNVNPHQYSCLKISWPEEPCSPWGHGRVGHDWVTEYTQAVLNIIEHSFWQRTCFWVRKFSSKGNFKGFLEESLVFVSGHCASDTDSLWPQAILAGQLCPQGHRLHISEHSLPAILLSLEVSGYLHCEWGRYERKGGKEVFLWGQAYWASHSAHILAGTNFRVSLTPPLAL